MKKINNRFLYLLGIIFGLNGLYVFFFTSDSDYFRVLGMFETNKLTAGLIYLGLSILLFWSQWIQNGEEDKPT